MKLLINGVEHDLPARLAEEPLLWVLREHLGLVGTRFGCGVGVCGACTVQVDGDQARSCQRSCREVAGAAITTIEGLAVGDRLHAVQEAWIAEKVPQCGYCQSAQLVAAAALLARVPAPSDAEIDAALSGILCRCGTYARIRRAVHRAAAALGAGGGRGG